MIIGVFPIIFLGDDMIKLIALDLDGTLLDDNKNISKENIDAINYAKAHGAKVVISTGRPRAGVEKVLNTLGINGDDEYLIIYNGGKILNVGTNETIYSTTINGKIVKELYEESKLLNTDIHAFRENEELITPKHNPYTDVEAKINFIEDHLYDFNKIKDDDLFIKCMLVSDQDNLTNAMANVNEKFYKEFSMVRSSTIFLEFLNKNSDKGKALKALADYLHIDMSEVMAMGDANNDISMIKVAGVGVAMENAFEEVFEYANYITDTNNNSGVAKAIMKYMK